MSAATPAQVSKENPATLGRNGGVIQSFVQLGLHGIEPPPLRHCKPLTGDLARFVCLLKANPQGVPCSEGRKVRSTHLPNHARTLRIEYGIDLRTVRIDAPTADKPKAWYGVYVPSQLGWQQVDQLPLEGAYL